ncbi:uncharacterized protein LOC132266321 [Cornus florida]|uniref:uncharacterized protein LOC132266321 n=1 Tax=Cornus florida TaxID=4283 RepID=UPI0028A08C44|nr:uncharacterized protein LOC132266321 [Cornus florida]
MKKQTLTVSYLTNSCGLSLESAISASKKVNIKSTEKSNSVLELLRSHGFTENHISCIISRYPNLLLADPERTLIPKIEYFESLGLVGPDLPRILCSSQSTMLGGDVFKEVTDAVKDMGFDPKSIYYILAVHQMSSNGKLNWEKKKEAYMSFSWSESTFNLAFKLQPICMIRSEKKIRELMNFFVNKVGLRASAIAKCPNVLLFSLERRIIPRCSVLQVLLSKGLIRKDVNVVGMLNVSIKNFETRFLTKYKDVAPEVIKAYEGEIGFQGFKVSMWNQISE